MFNQPGKSKSDLVAMAKKAAKEEVVKVFETAGQQISPHENQETKSSNAQSDITGLDSTHATLTDSDKAQIAARQKSIVDNLSVEVQRYALERQRKMLEERQKQFEPEKPVEKSEFVAPVSKHSRKMGSGGIKQKVQNFSKMLSRTKSERGRNTST